MMNISDAISFGSKELTNAGIENARRDASLLLSNTFERDAAFLISHPEYELAEHEKQKFETEIRRRAKREPLQHILGRQEFFGLEFAVSPEVLIPRPETELIVEEAIRIFADRGDFRFLEIGVGSGCISILILKNLPQATAVGADLSSAALEIANLNAGKHDVSKRLQLIHSDVFANVSDSGFDLIVANPPYIPTMDIETLQPEVSDFEPRSALDGGSDGLDIVRRIVDGSAEKLASGGYLLMEIGVSQAEKAAALFGHSSWSSVKFLRDLQNIERIVSAVRI